MQNNVINLVQEELPDDLIKISSFAKKRQTSKSYIYKLIYKGLIKCHKIGYYKISESQALKAIRELGKVS